MSGVPRREEFKARAWEAVRAHRTPARAAPDVGDALQPRVVRGDVAYRRLIARYREFHRRHPDHVPDYFDDRHTWMR